MNQEIEDFALIILDSFTPYEGKDRYFREEPRCFNCNERPPAGLLRCSRCQVAWYCNSKCQQSHYIKEHQNECRHIAKCIKKVQQEELPLRSFSDLDFGFNPEPENLFETQVGIFWGLIETRDYMRARYALFEAYWEAAYNCETKQVYEKALFHNLELLRLCSGDNLGVRFQTPFLLLDMNRDDDAFAFIKYRMGLESGGDYEDEIAERHSQSREGEWIYPRESNCRHQDIFKEFPNCAEQYVSLAFLVALAIIKLRIIAAHDAVSRSIDIVLQSTKGECIQEARFALSEMLIEKYVDIDDQRRQVNRLLDIIDSNNPSMLPAILNPLPMKEQPRPQSYSMGHPSEVYDILMNCNRCFLRVPGAEDLLKERFGDVPTYNFNTDWMRRNSEYSL